MNDTEEAILSVLRDFGGESSAFLMTNPDGPCGHLGDSDTLLNTIKSLHDQGALVYDTGNDVITIT